MPCLPRLESNGGRWSLPKKSVCQAAQNCPIYQSVKKCLLLGALGLLLTGLTSLQAQVFVVPLPPEPVPTGPVSRPLSDASELVETFGDPAGNTLYIIRYTNSDSASPGPGQNPYDLWLLVSARGTVLASRFFQNLGSGTVTKVVSFSRQRIVAQVDGANGVALEAFRPQGGDFFPRVWCCSMMCRDRTPRRTSRVMPRKSRRGNFWTRPLWPTAKSSRSADSIRPRCGPWGELEAANATSLRSPP